MYLPSLGYAHEGKKDEDNKFLIHVYYHQIQSIKDKLLLLISNITMIKLTGLSDRVPLINFDPIMVSNINMINVTK